MCYHSSQTSETKKSVLNHKNLGGGACCEYEFLYAQFYRIRGGDARGEPPPSPSPVIFEMTKLTPENYISLESRKPNLPQGVLAMFAYEEHACYVLGSEISLESHFWV